ncbi:MAG: hypothetical protein LKI39_07085 [Bacteroides sp.]|jgi:hypothetical protein|nr:hypothetical protein [Bacteroides sp.]
MKRLLFIQLLIFAFMVVSCHRDTIHDSQLLRAESLMDSQPDSSYQILKSLSSQNFFKPDRIYYGLLLAEATNKTFRSLLPCDSLLNEAIRYYSGGINRAKALLYKERIQTRMNMPKEAMDNCFAALKELNGTDKTQLRVKGMIYEDLGNLYSDQVLIDKAMEMFRNAETCYQNADYREGISSIKGNIGWIYFLGRDTLNARVYTKEALKLAIQQNNFLFVPLFYHNLSCTYRDKDSILFYGKHSLEYDKAPYLKAAITVGYVFINRQKLDSAEYYFHLALKDTTIETRALAYYGLKDVMEEKEDYHQALEYSGRYSGLMDSIYFFKQTSEVEQKAYKYEADLSVYKEKMNMKLMLFLIVSSCLLAIALSMLLLQRVSRRRKMLQLEYERDKAALDANVAELQYRIASLRREQEKDKEHISLKEQEVRKLADEKAELCNILFQKTPIYKRIEQLSMQSKGKRQQEVQILLEKEQMQLRSTVSEIYKDYLAYLNHAYPKYTEDDCLLSCLSLCGWDDFTIALCFGKTSKQVVVQRRYRLKHKEGN